MPQLRVAGLVAFLAGCAHALPPPARTLPLAPPRASVPLTFRLPVFLGMMHADLGEPIVEVTINGTRSRLLVDTGSTHIVLTSRFARAHDIATHPTEAGKDHAGAEVSVSDAAPFDLGVGGYHREIKDGLAIDLPAVFDLMGIAGVLSPQVLIDRGCVVLDLPARRLLITDEPIEAIRADLAERSPELRLTSAARTDAPRLVMVTAWLDRHPPVVAELDTGARRTEFLASDMGETKRPKGYSPSKAPVPKGKPFGASSGTVRCRASPRTRPSRASRRTTTSRICDLAADEGASRGRGGPWVILHRRGAGGQRPAASAGLVADRRDVAVAQRRAAIFLHVMMGVTPRSPRSEFSGDAHPS